MLAAVEVASCAAGRAERAAGLLADAAVRALVEEAELTPKPALVDARGSGAHRDMDLEMLRVSARSLRATFQAIAECAYAAKATAELRERLAELGREGERAMLLATGGVNTHRGAVWTLGLLCAGTAMLGDAPWTAEDVCANAGRLARIPDRALSGEATHGVLALARFGVRGARGEAEDGFPHIVDVALPKLRVARAQGARETQARLDALLGIMSELDDTCLLHRGGAFALAAAKDGAARVLELGGTATASGLAALMELDGRMLELGASPGGSADLLAGTLLLDRMESLNGEGIAGLRGQEMYLSG